jgi:phage portal protein BeeE
MDFPNLFGRGRDRPPAPEMATAEDVERYNLEWAKEHSVGIDDGADYSDPTVEHPATKDLNDRLKQKTEFPWLYDPARGVRWGFDPIKLRNLGQGNTWVGMLVQTITKEIAETPWSIVKQENRNELRKRLTTHPEKRTPIAKQAGAAEFPDATAETIDDLLRNPNPDHNWHDLVEMWMGDLLEIGSGATVKAFPKSVYRDTDDGPELAVDPSATQPRALQVTAPEVWTKDYDDRTGLLEGFWQFDKEKAPGSGQSEGGTAGSRGFRTPIHFDKAELMWTDLTPRSNRRYGMPPTLLVEEFLKSLDLAVTQEQQYLSRGSIPSGAWVFEEWDRQEVKEWKEENAENVKGKPHKSLMFAGRGGDVRYEAMSMNFSELEFTERMKWYARVVASVFQVPTAVVGIEPEKVNYNTFQGERETFEENTLGPYLQKLERFINNQLIEPHWGREYHFEFKPGVSESTRDKISSRVVSEFQAGIRTRNETRQELGLDEVDDDIDGFQDEVVTQADPDDAGEALDELVASEMSKAEYEVGDETIDITPPEYMVDAADAGSAAESDPDVSGNCGTGVGDRRADQISNDNVGPGVVREIAAYLDSHEEDVTADGHPRTWTAEELSDCGNRQYGKWGGVGDGRAREWAQSKVNEIDRARGNELTYPEIERSRGDSGNANSAVQKDEPLRETDQWYQFDVQPSAVEELQDAIADDIQELYDAVLSDDRIQSEIERLAADDDIDKSTTSLARRLKDILSQTRIAGDIADAIREHTTDAIADTLDDTIADVDVDDSDPDPDAVDIQAIRGRLADRDVGFADRFADDLAEDIRETVGDAWAEGKNSFEIREEIAEQGDIDEGWNGAERIARQELQIATGEARSAVADDLNKVEVWNDSGDDRVRPAHAAMDGLWKRPGEDWEVDYSTEGRGVQNESVPGDSEPGIGCRCTTLLRDREEVDDDNYAGTGNV